MGSTVILIAVPSLAHASSEIVEQYRAVVIKAESHVPSSSWTGFYAGGGGGVQKIISDLDIKSKNKSEAANYHNCDVPDPSFGIQDTGPAEDRRTFINSGYNAGAKYDFARNCINSSTNVVTDNPVFSHFENSNFNFSDSKEVSSDWEAFGTAVIGYDYQVSKRFIVGAFADFDFGSTKTEFSQTYTGIPDGVYYGANGSFRAGQDLAQDVTISGDFENDYSFTLGGRIGYLLANQKTLGYISAGYSRTSIDGHLNYNISGDAGVFSHDTHDRPYDSVPISASQKISEDINGFTLGAGAEHKLNSNWSARLEYRYTWYENIKAKFSEFAFSDDSSIVNFNTVDGHSVNARTTQTDTTFDIDPNIHSVRAVLSYKFGKR